MSYKSSLSKNSPINKFLIQLGLILYLTLPQFKHIASFITGATQKGYNGKVTDISDLEHFSKHRTCIGKFLTQSTWNEDYVLRALQQYTIRKIWDISKRTRAPIFVIIDDTISEKTKPSSKAKHPIEKCGFHHSHLKNKKVYGHQIVGVMLQCDGITIPFHLEMYDKSCMSKIELSMKVLELLPPPPHEAYVLGDSWYTCKKIINTTKNNGFNYLGALKTNRIIYPDQSKLGWPISEYAKKLKKSDYHLVKVGNHEYYVFRYEGRLNDIKEAVVLLSWPKDAFLKEGCLKAFLCTDINLTSEQILNRYTKRWPIEVFFRQGKMRLGLDLYQIRSAKAIKRFWILLIMAYTYCTLGIFDTPVSFSEGLSASRKKCQSHLLEFVYSKAMDNVPLEQILKELKVA